MADAPDRDLAEARCLATNLPLDPRRRAAALAAAKARDAEHRANVRYLLSVGTARRAAVAAHDLVRRARAGSPLGEGDLASLAQCLELLAAHEAAYPGSDPVCHEHAALQAVVAEMREGT